jgi:hypothetical protein
VRGLSRRQHERRRRQRRRHRLHGDALRDGHADTTCDVTIYGPNENVHNHKCYPCGATFLASTLNDPTGPGLGTVEYEISGAFDFTLPNGYRVEGARCHQIGVNE